MATINERELQPSATPEADALDGATPANDTDRDSQDSQKEQLASGPVVTSDPVINAIQEQHPGGLTVVIYGPTTKEMPGGYENTNNNRELTVQAKGMAEVHNTVSASGGNPELGVAIPAINKTGIENATKQTYDNVLQRYQAAKPEGAPDEPEHLKIKNLSLFYHGGQKQLYLPGADLKTSNVEEFVGSVGYSLRDDVFVQLYACNAAKGEGSLAEVMAEELGGESNVFGHTTAAHTTENSNARVFGTLGDGTQMFDVMFPEAFIEAEVQRIWGENLEADKYDSARAKVVQRLTQYYHRVFGLRGGWDDDAKTSYDGAEVQERGYYANRGYRVPGREMFLEPGATAEESQERWMTYAAQSERSRFNAIAPVSESFGAGGGTTVAPTVGPAAPERTDTNGGSSTAPTTSPRPEPRPGSNAPTTSPRPVPRPMSIQEVNASINVQAALNYNNSRPYDEAQWRVIQEVVGTDIDGDPGRNTARAVASWQSSKGLKVDGKVGSQTLAAISTVKTVPSGSQDAEQQQEEQPEAESGEIPSGNVTANFAWSEFACNDGTPVPRQYQQNVVELCQQLEAIREAAGGASISVNSGYRTRSHNNNVGGASNSQHLYAKAADIRVGGKSPAQLKTIVERLISDGRIRQGGVGLYNTFLHYDIRGNRARW